MKRLLTLATAVTTVLSMAAQTANARWTKNDVSNLAATVTTSDGTPDKGTAVALKRGLMALNLKTSGGTGNLVSWRARKSDSRNYKFKLYRGTNADTQTTAMNGGNFIMGKTNFSDTGGSTSNYYRLEVYDEANNLIETEVSEKTWDNQTKYITLEGGAPTDPTSAKATYTPNDASFCDMDGDGEYEIVMKWAPSNEKDAASSGTTSPAFYACYKLSGKRLWMLHTGPNMFNSAHTTPFVAWDMDGDGFGEFMVKTAPGAIDGNGKYVIMDGDDPTASLKNSNGKQVSGPEYITVFDGRTGAELKTEKYHTAYGDVSTSFWGDTYQNRSERYLAAIAWLDGEDKNPSAIFARGYYKGCNIGAYDWDGKNLTLRWLHRGTATNAGTVTYADGTVKTLSSSVYGEGAHWISIGDVTGDGRQEIHYGSGALNADGTTLYRTGLGHGDAIHLGDFIPSRPGQEYFMAHEEKSSNGNYGVDLRDAKTGEILVRRTAGSDTGRGLMGHFNPEAEDAYFFDSEDGSKNDSGNFQFQLFNTKGEEVSIIGFGSSGATANYRLFWNGTLADDFFDKSIVCQFNPEYMSFDRMKINNGQYVVGTLNNDSKKNPCVSGDLLGDWREEIVNWTQSGDDYQLVINATSYTTDYTLPHLMDDYAYRAQLISQNCGYNQPPHVSYDPRTEKTIAPETFLASNNADKSLGKYWGSLYTTYAVYVPEGVTAWSVSNRSTEGKDTLKMTTIAAGKIIPANRAIIFNSTIKEPQFVPTSLASNATVSTSYLKGFYCDSVVTAANSYQEVYEFRNGLRGVGLYRTNGKVIEGGKAYAIFGTSASPAASSYVLGSSYNTLSEAEEWTAGDVTSDGKVDVVDVTATISHILGKTPTDFSAKAADVNGDDKIDVVDVTCIIDIILYGPKEPETSRTIVDIDFSSPATQEGSTYSITGKTGKMTFSKYDTDNASGTGFALGYGDSGKGVLRVGNGSGVVSIDEADQPAASDMLQINFDMWFGNLINKNAGVELRNKAGQRVAGFSMDRYNSKVAYNDFNNDDNEGLDLLTYVSGIGKSGSENDAIVADNNRSSFELYVDYKNKTLAGTVVNAKNGTKNGIELPFVEGLSDYKITQFVVFSNYNNGNRRCWFDNLKIEKIPQ